MQGCWQLGKDLRLVLKIDCGLSFWLVVWISRYLIVSRFFLDLFEKLFLFLAF